MRRDQQLVLQFISAYNCACASSFSLDSWPEDTIRTQPAVEALARDGSRVMAIEHTLAQPFPGERKDSAIFRRVVAPVESDTSLLQVGFDVTISTNIEAIPTGVDWNGSAVLLREWLRRELPTHPEGTSQQNVPGLGFELKITIEKVFDNTPGFAGSIFVMRNAPDDRLRDVLETALRQKLPKLRTACGDTKILLLERADVLGGYYRFESALRQLLDHQFQEMKPSEIWLVNTVGQEREDVLYFYKIWPSYFEHRVRKGSNNIFQKLRSGHI